MFLDTLLWLGIVLGIWGMLVVACAKGWIGMVIVCTGLIILGHFLMPFVVINNAFCSIVYLRRHIQGRETYFEPLASA